MATAPPPWKPNDLVFAGYVMVGAGYALDWFRSRQTAQLSGLRGLRGPSADPATQMPALPYTQTGKLPPMSPTGLGIQKMKLYAAGSIENRVGFIRDQIIKDSIDPQVITEARTIVSRKCADSDGGKKWCIAPKDYRAEVAAIYRAVVDANFPTAVRYTHDHPGVDLFSGSSLMRRLPAGDCDEQVVRVGALLRAIGYSIKLRIVAPAGHPKEWAHIYLIAGIPPSGNAQWVPIDVTEPQHGPFWEVPPRMISTVMDIDVPDMAQP